MSLRALTPAFVATISALAYGTACNPPRPHPQTPTPRPETGNPPEPVTTATPSALPTSNTTTDPTQAPAATASATAAVKTPPRHYNPRDAKGRTILRDYQGDSCHVYLPYPKLKPGERRLPGTAPPKEAVKCPAIMLDKAFESCRDGTLQAAGDACKCFQPGNPPRQFVSACPASSQ